MTDSDIRVETWHAVPGHFCEVTDGQPDGRALVRSVARVTDSGRRIAGSVLAQTLSTRGYPQVWVWTRDGVRVSRKVHSLQMEALEGPCPPGMQVRHMNDVSTDNRWAPGGEANCGPGKPGNLVYGTEKQNREDRHRNSPPAPKPPPKLCEPHGNPVTRGSATRCHDCVVEIGLQGSRLLREGLSPAAAAAELGYSSPDGLAKLAARYGSYRFGDHGESLPGPVTSRHARPPRPRWSRRVTTTVRRWFRRGDAA